MKTNAAKVAQVAELRNLWIEAAPLATYTARNRFQAAYASLNASERVMLDTWAEAEDQRFASRCKRDRGDIWSEFDSARR